MRDTAKAAGRPGEPDNLKQFFVHEAEPCPDSEVLWHLLLEVDVAEVTREWTPFHSVWLAVADGQGPRVGALGWSEVLGLIPQALFGTDLRDADLRDADLRGVNLSCANLAGASLAGANLSLADLRRADLRGADLTGVVDLHNADLTGVTGAILST